MVVLCDRPRLFEAVQPRDKLADVLDWEWFVFDVLGSTKTSLSLCQCHFNKPRVREW